MKLLDDQLSQFAVHALDEAYPCLIVDAGYLKVRESGAVRSRAVLLAIGIDGDDRRQFLESLFAGLERKKSQRC